MSTLQFLLPKRLIRFVAGHEPYGEAECLAALGGLNDHYLRDVGYRREQPRPRGLLHPWMM